MITIRPFAYTDAEYEAIAAIEGAMFGDHSVSIEEWKHDDQNRDPDYPFQRDLIFKHDMLVAFVEYRQIRWAYHPQKYDCRIFVHPDHDAPDIRPTYLEHLLDILADKDLIAITSGMLEDKPEAMKFFADHGFEEVAREQISTLDVTAVDPQQFAPLITRVTDSGIVIRSVSQLMADEADWQRKLFDLDITISRDIPSLGEKHPFTFETWLSARLDGPAYDPDGWFVALDGDHFVGESQGSINAAYHAEFLTGATGVRREYRRRGIASALKAHLILYAKQRGVQEMSTTNDSRNPMYGLNLQLGFKPESAWVRVEKTLER